MGRWHHLRYHAPVHKVRWLIALAKGENWPVPNVVFKWDTGTEDEYYDTNFLNFEEWVKKFFFLICIVGVDQGPLDTAAT
jgi:hypothetical protein